jgi:hypothetical protein
METTGWSGIVAGPGQVMGVAQARLVLAQAQEARRDFCRRDRLAHPPSAEPGRVGAHDLIEGEQRGPSGEGRFGRVYPFFTLRTSPARQGLQVQPLKGYTLRLGVTPSYRFRRFDGAGEDGASHAGSIARRGALSALHQP